MNSRYTLALLLVAIAGPIAHAQQMRILDPAVSTGTRLSAERASAANAMRTATSAERRGFFASVDRLSYNAAAAVDGNGGVHLAFYFSDEGHDDDPRDLAAYYTFCPGSADCADPDSWSWLIQFDSQVNEVQILATQDGRPRILVRRYGSRANEYDYWACDVDCTTGEYWYGLRILEAAGTELWNTDLPQHSFALDSQERPRFVYSNGWGVGRPEAIYYAYCDEADCTEPGSWQDTPIYGPIEFVTITSDYASLVFEDDRPRVVTRLNRSGLPERVDYHQCDADCGERTSWYSVTLEHPEGKMWANWDLELDALGRPRVALYEPAGIDIVVGGKLYYGWCDGDCREPGSFQITEIVSGEGKNVDLSIDSRGRTYMVYDAGQRGLLGAAWCDDNCTDQASWQRVILETSEQLAEEFWPANPLSCSNEERAWLDAVPTVSFDAQDRLIIGYDVKNVAVCYYQDPTNPQAPPQSRVERIWWAVRLGFYARPGDNPSTPVEDQPEVPATASLEPNFPNPFNPMTTIPFALEQSGSVTLTVHDMLGRTVAVLVDGVQPAGRHEIAWDAGSHPSGSYVYRLEAGGRTQTRVLTLLK